MNGMKDYIITVDIGNTSTSLGLYRNGRVTRRERVESTRALHNHIAQKLEALVGERPIGGAVIGSVVPAVTSRWVSVIKKRYGVKALIVSHQVKLLVPITYPEPETIGADRIANACGAADRYGVPVVVADFGTALTFDVVSAKQGYVGGVITPGLPLMFDYLAEKTALLPHVKPGPTRHTVGKSTVEAIQIGAHWGYMGMVREILARVRKKYGDEMKVCATGGYASWVLRGLDGEFVVDKDLTLYGLGRIYDINQ